MHRILAVDIYHTADPVVNSYFRYSLIFKDQIAVPLGTFQFRNFRHYLSHIHPECIRVS